jgi:uncharacterized membrane protein
MATLGQAKALGGVGSILLLIGLIPQTAGILGIVGLILILFAVKYISDVMGDPQVFRNMIISVVLSIVGIIVAVVTVLGALAAYFHFGTTAFTPTSTPTDIFALIALVLIGLAIVWVFLFVGSFFLKRSYDAISTRLNVGMFHTTGLLYVIGAGLLIVFGVGLIVLFIAEILQIVAFFSLPDQMPMGPQPMPGQMVPPPSGTR